MNKNGIVLFESKDGVMTLPVRIDTDTVWLTQEQMCQLFGRSQPVIVRHISNAFNDGEVDREVAYAKFAYTTRHGAMAGKTQTKDVGLYNLDVIISVGYRVKSQRGVEFRRWATSVLKEYLIKGYAMIFLK